MIAKKKEFTIGAVMIALFAVVLILVFSPVFNGQNGLQYLDALYNSISKGSAYYIPKVKEETAKFAGKTVSVQINMGKEETAKQTAMLFEKGGAKVEVSGSELKIDGDLGKVFDNCLADADSMYINDGAALVSKYGYDERQVLLNWHTAFKAMDKALTKEEKFEEARAILEVREKALEPSYNFYKIEPQKIGDKIGIVVFSLVFYVIYTVWYGFAIMYLFEGWGLQLEGH